MRSGARPQSGEGGSHLSKRSDARLGYGCRRWYVLARCAIDPEGANSSGVRARDIASEAVADHDRIFGCEVEGRQGRFEDARVGLSDVDLAGDDRGLERWRECGA